MYNVYKVKKGGMIMTVYVKPKIEFVRITAEEKFAAGSSDPRPFCTPNFIANIGWTGCDEQTFSYAT